MRCVAVFGASHGALAPTSTALWLRWARCPSERGWATATAAAATAAAGGAAAALPSQLGAGLEWGAAVQVYGAAMAGCGLLWLLFGASDPMEWGSTLGSRAHTDTLAPPLSSSPSLSETAPSRLRGLR